MTSHTFRVRQVLERMDSRSRAYLKNHLPPKFREAPPLETQRYPSALLNALPKEERYSILGSVAEIMLRRSLVSEISVDVLIASVKACCPLFGSVEEAKVRKSATTKPFLDCLVETRRKLELVLRSEYGTLEFEPRIASGLIEGHPDMKNKKQIFEVKLTGLLNTNWAMFLAQLFAYGAICPETTDLYLVLPLQKAVLGFDIQGWSNREVFVKALEEMCPGQCKCSGCVRVDAAPEAGMLLCMEHNVGQHAAKYKRIEDSLRPFVSRRPYQIFLGGPRNSRIAVDDGDVARSCAEITHRELLLFIHSQYIINLCTKADDDWNVQLLIRNLQIARALGCKGVVVHVGKSVGQSESTALENMRLAILRALEHASEDCPLLLETPSGQGTEMLRDREVFLHFVESFESPRLKVCVDTCHVFACGDDPVEYITDAVRRRLLRLVHFNDSLGDHGSRVDRHSFAGRGKIGIATMTRIARLCSESAVPMLYEV